MHTTEELIESLHDIADYANLDLTFTAEATPDKPGWCTLQERKGEPHIVHIDTCYGYAQDIPDRAKPEHFAQVIARAMRP